MVVDEGFIEVRLKGPRVRRRVLKEEKGELNERGRALRHVAQGDCKGFVVEIDA